MIRAKAGTMKNQVTVVNTMTPTWAQIPWMLAAYVAVVSDDSRVQYIRLKFYDPSSSFSFSAVSPSRSHLFIFSVEKVYR